MNVQRKKSSSGCSPSCWTATAPRTCPTSCSSWSPAPTSASRWTSGIPSCSSTAWSARTCPTLRRTAPVRAPSLDSCVGLCCSVFVSLTLCACYVVFAQGPCCWTSTWSGGRPPPLRRLRLRLRLRGRRRSRMYCMLDTACAWSLQGLHCLRCICFGGARGL